MLFHEEDIAFFSLLSWSSYCRSFARSLDHEKQGELAARLPWLRLSKRGGGTFLADICHQCRSDSAHVVVRVGRPVVTFGRRASHQFHDIAAQRSAGYRPPPLIRWHGRGIAQRHQPAQASVLQYLAWPRRAVGCHRRTSRGLRLDQDVAKPFPARGQNKSAEHPSRAPRAPRAEEITLTGVPEDEQPAGALSPDNCTGANPGHEILLGLEPANAQDHR
jgi:hypothetical protein